MDIVYRYSRGAQISPEHSVTDLKYADDVVLFAENFDGYEKCKWY